MDVCSVADDYDAQEGFICTLLDECIREKQIKEVITKQMLESVSYKIRRPK